MAKHLGSASRATPTQGQLATAPPTVLLEPIRNLQAIAVRILTHVAAVDHDNQVLYPTWT